MNRTGFRALSPGPSVLTWIAYAANIVTVGAGVVAGLLTLMGALGAVKGDRQRGS